MHQTTALKGTWTAPLLAYAVLTIGGCSSATDDRRGGTDEPPSATGEPTTAASTAPSGSSSTETIDPQLAGIPNDFPLAAGWPGDDEAEGKGSGLEGPGRTLPPVEISGCDASDEAPYVDRLRADWSSIEDHRQRQLTTYDTPEAASDAMAGVVDYFRACSTPSPDSHQDDHSDRLANDADYDVQPTSVGEESWVIVQTETIEGYPTTSLVVRHLVRVGVAVLLIVETSEGGAALPDDLERHVDQPADDAAPVVRAMCRFTADGC